MDFSILGPLEVRANGRSLPLGGPRQRALLAILLLNANRVVSRDRLVEELWEEQPEAPGRALNVQISRLRKALSAEDHGESLLVTQPPGYRLRVDADELDLDRFERLVGEGQVALRRSDPERAAAKLREALALWRGRPLADLEFEPFARLEVERLEELRLTALEDRIEAELALGGHAALVGELETLIVEHPLRERMRSQLMLALYRSGRQAEALEAYDSARTLLVENLGLEPSPALAELQQAILRQEGALEAQPSGTRGAVLEATPREASPSQGSPPGPGQRVPSASHVGVAGDVTVSGLHLLRGRSWLLPAVGVVAAAAIAIVLIASSDGEPGIGPIREDALALVSRESDEVTAVVPLRAAPTRVAAGLGSVWVTHYDAGTVSRIDPRSRTVRQMIRVGGGPSGMAVAGGAVWVANTLDGTVSRIDPGTDAVVQTIPVGSQPSALAVTAGDLWVANRGDGTVSRVDARAGRTTATVTTGSGPSGLAAADGIVWSSNQEAGTVSRIDARTGAVTQTIDVGNAPAAIAVTKDGVLVLDALDSTVSIVDPGRGAVTTTTPVDGVAGALATAGGSAWMTDEVGGILSRVEPRTGIETVRTRVGGRPVALASASEGLWVGVQAGGTSHRGGTLTVVGWASDINSIDPAVLGSLIAPTQLLGLTNDGLVTLNHVGGAEGSRLVPDLALSLPVPTDDGRSYTFHLRPGVRYSTGELVRPRDVRGSLERLFELGSSGRSFYDGIVGADACAPHPGGCDLSRGIVADDRQNTVTFHLSAADPDFLYKLALPDAFVLPASTPSREADSPLPATGPYVISSFARGRELRLVRNPRFREWSRPAQPAGYPDEIVWKLGLSPDRATVLMERGQADFMANVGPIAHGHRDVLATRHASQLHVNSAMGTGFFFLNTRARPFDDVRVRRALNFAVDRRRSVEIFGGSEGARPTCQILPPQMPGYTRYCPYTRDPRPDGRWRGPDLARARRLIAASGTQGMKVGVWTTPEPQFAIDEGRYVTALLGRLGYDASLHALPEREFLRYTDDSRNHAQVISGGWAAEYLSPSTFIGKLRCSYFIPNSTASINSSGFCDPAMDRRIDRAEALQAAHPAQAATLWARLDRELTNRAVWLPTVTGRVTDIVSRRVGNYQYHPLWGVLLDQLWVR